MKNFVFVLVLLGLMAGFVAAQSNHHPVYLFGGYGHYNTYTYYPKHIFVYDNTGTTPVVKTLCATPNYYTRYPSLVMDYDNNNLLMCMSGTSSTTYPTTFNNALVRYDMTANSWSVLWRDPRVSNHKGPGSYKYGYPYNNVHVDPMLFARDGL